MDDKLDVVLPVVLERAHVRRRDAIAAEDFDAEKVALFFLLARVLEPRGLDRPSTASHDMLTFSGVYQGR